jgi:hypothetical protein
VINYEKTLKIFTWRLPVFYDILSKGTLVAVNLIVYSVALRYGTEGKWDDVRKFAMKYAILQSGLGHSYLWLQYWK